MCTLPHCRTRVRLKSCQYNVVHEEESAKVKEGHFSECSSSEAPSQSSPLFSTKIIDPQDEHRHQMLSGHSQSFYESTAAHLSDKSSSEHEICLYVSRLRGGEICNTKQLLQSLLCIWQLDMRNKRTSVVLVL